MLNINKFVEEYSRQLTAESDLRIFKFERGGSLTFKNNGCFLSEALYTLYLEELEKEYLVSVDLIKVNDKYAILEFNLKDDSCVCILFLKDGMMPELIYES